MDNLQTLLEWPVVESIGWALVHSIWQIALVAALYAVARSALRNRSALLRYGLACVALGTMIVAVTATTCIVWSTQSQPSAVAVTPVASTPDFAPVVLADNGEKTLPEFVLVEPVERPIDTDPVPERTGLATLPVVPIEQSNRHEEATSNAAASLASQDGTYGSQLVEIINDWLPWLVAAWLLGVVAFSARLACGWLGVHRLCRCGTSPVAGSLQKKLNRLCHRLGVHRAVRLVQSTMVEVPAVAGHLRPVILMPVSFVTGLSPSQIEVLLLHELAHIRRHDYLVNLIQTAIETLLFYHPAVWWLSRQIRQERENCCDDLVLSVCDDRTGYAQALASMEELRAKTCHPALAVSGGSLLTRIRRIVGGRSEGPTRRHAWLAGVMVLGMILIMAIGVTGATSGTIQDKDEAAAAEENQAANNKETDGKETENKTTEPKNEPSTTSTAEDASALPKDDPRRDLRFTLATDKQEYFLGENIILYYEVENLGKREPSITMGWDSRNTAGRALRFKIEMIDQQGRKAYNPYPNPLEMGGMGSKKTFKPGDKFCEEVPLMRYREPDRAGTYTIKVYHDLGWKKLSPEDWINGTHSDIPSGPLAAPILTTTLRLRMPNARQARQIVDKALKSPTDSNRLWGERGRPYADYGLLHYPVYLPIMRELAEKGDARGFQALGSMAFPEATEALLDLAKHKDQAIASQAQGLLVARMPQVPTPDFTNRRQVLAARSWTPALKARAVQLAWPFLAGKNYHYQIHGGQIIQSLGSKDDLPKLIKVMDRLLPAYKDDEVEQGAWLRPASVSDTLASAATALIERGATPPATADTPGRAVAFLVGLDKNPKSRPKGWEKIAASLLKHELPFLRSRALQRMSVPLDDEAATSVGDLIESKYAAVQSPACILAGKSKLARFQQPLMDVLRTTTNDWVLRDAFPAAAACGVKKDRILETLLDRLERHSNDRNMVMLSLMIDGSIRYVGGSGGQSHSNWQPFLGSLQAAWRKFIETNRATLQKGELVELDDPTVTPDLLPPGYYLHVRGRPWPAEHANYADKPPAPFGKAGKHVTRPRNDPFRVAENLPRSPAELWQTALDVRITATKKTIFPVVKKLTNGERDVLELPIRIENRSSQTITADLAHEWYGGEWPETDLGAAVKCSDDKSDNWRVCDVYRSGELGSKTKATVWKPGESHDFVLRMNWPGTGSVHGQPLIDANEPGKYTVQFSLVFKTGETRQYAVSSPITIDVQKKPSATPSQPTGFSAEHGSSPDKLAANQAKKDKIVITIRISMDEKADTQTGHVVLEYLVFESGLAMSDRHVYDSAHQDGHSRKLTMEELAKAKNIVGRLPIQSVEVPKNKSVIVAMDLPQGKKEVVYDRTKLPMEMKELFSLLGGIREEARGSLEFESIVSEKQHRDQGPILRGRMVDELDKPLLGLRSRLTVEGTEYRKDRPLSLHVELKNVSDKPIPFAAMTRPNVIVKAEDEQSRWLGNPRSVIGISPWQGRPGSLAPGEVLRWDVPMGYLRFVRTIKPGEKIKLRVEGPVQKLVPGKLPIELTSNSVSLKFRDGNPPTMKASDLPEVWTKSMTFVYRNFTGIFGPGNSALEIDGEGHAVVINAPRLRTKPVRRYETQLGRESLNRLAKLLHDNQAWKLNSLQAMTNPDEPEIHLGLLSGVTSMVGHFPDRVIRKESALAVIQKEAESLMTEVINTATHNAEEHETLGPMKELDKKDEAPGKSSKSQPATLVIEYGMFGDEPMGLFRLQRKTMENGGWRVDKEHEPIVVRNGSFKRIKDLRPGVYDMGRMKTVKHLDRRMNIGGKTFLCDRRDVELKPGKETTVRFDREKNAKPISGRVTGLPDDSPYSLTVEVRSPKVTGALHSSKEDMLPTYDALSCRPGKPFETAPIPPGEYTLLAEAYRPLTRDAITSTAWPLPDFLGTVKVTVPAEGKAPKVEIKMLPRKEFEKQLKKAETDKGKPVNEITASDLNHLFTDLKVQDVAVRKEAALALGKLKDPRAIEPLIEAFHDTAHESFLDALSALGNFKGELVDTVLLGALRHPDRRARTISVKLLDRRGWKPTNREEKMRYLVAAKGWDKILQAGPAARPIPDRPNGVEGPFELDIPIVLDLKSAEQQKPAITPHPWIEFRKKDGKVQGILDIRFISWPQATWSFALDVVNKKGAVLKHVETTYTNSGTIMKYPGTDIEALRFDLGDEKNLSTATKFRLYVKLKTASTADKMTWPSAVLAEGKIDFNHEYNKIDCDLQARKGKPALHLDYLAFKTKYGRLTGNVHVEFLSSPAETWWVELALVDADGNIVSKDRCRIKCDGTYKKDHPERLGNGMFFEFGSDKEMRSRAKRYQFRLLDPVKTQLKPTSEPGAPSLEEVIAALAKRKAKYGEMTFQIKYERTYKKPDDKILQTVNRTILTQGGIYSKKSNDCEEISLRAMFSPQTWGVDDQQIKRWRKAAAAGYLYIKRRKVGNIPCVIIGTAELPYDKDMAFAPQYDWAPVQYYSDKITASGFQKHGNFWMPSKIEEFLFYGCVPKGFEAYNGLDKPNGYVFGYIGRSWIYSDHSSLKILNVKMGKLTEPSPENQSLSLQARVVGADGKPVDSSLVTFWKTITEKELKTLLENFKLRNDRPQVWRDSVTGKRWCPIQHVACGDKATVEKLMPGEYRVTAHLTHGTPTSVVASDVIRLDGSRKQTEVKLKFKKGPSLTVKAIDQKTAKAVDFPSLFLVRPDGLPVISWSSGYWDLRGDKDGVFTFKDLAPGKYTLEVSRQAYRYGVPKYIHDAGPIDITLEPGKDAEITVKMRESRPDAKEVERRWPWAVTGTVTDANGKPIQGVNVTANCGIGTLKPTGTTATDAQGKYLLRFGPGVTIVNIKNESKKQSGAGIQAAMISVAKSGYVEKNLARQGDLCMADTMPEDDSLWGGRKKIVLPGKPYRLDFIMVPTSTIEEHPN